MRPGLASEVKTAIRQVNGSLAFASLCNAKDVSIHHNGPYCYKIQGTYVRKISAAQAKVHKTPRFSQLYFAEAGEGVQSLSQNPICSDMSQDMKQLTAGLYEELREVNPYAQIYKTMREVHDTYTQSGEEVPNLTIIFNDERVLDQRTYNISTSNEVAALLVGTPSHNEPCKTLSVSLRHEHDRFRTIESIDPNSDALVYPLLYPRGDRGWFPGMEGQARPAPARRGRARDQAQDEPGNQRSLVDDEAIDEDDPPPPASDSESEQQPAVEVAV
jgi:hypothetical protein